MAIDQFRREPVEDVIDRERTLLLRHLGVEQYLQQQVAEFAGQFIPITIVDRFQNFVGLFERVGLDGVEGLFPVPWASAGCAQPRHDRNRPLETFSSGRDIGNQCK